MARLALVTCMAIALAACAGGPAPVRELPPPDPGVEVPEIVTHDVEPRLSNVKEIRDLLVDSYPRQLRLNGISGSVVLYVYVDRHGRVTQVRPRNPTSEPEFTRAAELVVRAMRFESAETNGEPVGTWIMQRVDYDSR